MGLSITHYFLSYNFPRICPRGLPRKVIDFKIKHKTISFLTQQLAMGVYFYIQFSFLCMAPLPNSRISGTSEFFILFAHQSDWGYITEMVQNVFYNFTEMSYTAMFDLRRVMFLPMKSSTLFTGGSNSGLSNIEKNKASKNHCRNPPPRHQARNTEINWSNCNDFSRGSFLTSFSCLPNLQVVVVFTLFLWLYVIWVQTVHRNINSETYFRQSIWNSPRQKSGFAEANKTTPSLSKIPERPQNNFLFNWNVSHFLGYLAQ